MSRAAAPDVTIGIPVYNGERFLPAALESLQGQDFSNFEVLVSDNASSDSTPDIVREFAKQDSRFVYLRNEENVGGARNSNVLLEAASAPNFKWMHYDDVCQPNFLSESLEVLSNQHLVAVCPRVTLIDAEGRVVGQRQDGDLVLDSPEPHARLREVLTRVVAQIQFGVVRTAVARATGGIVRSMSGEMIFPAAMALRGRIGLVSEQSLSIRVHPDRHGGRRGSEASWVDPSRPHVVFPYSRTSPLLLRAIRQSPLATREKSRCTATVLRRWTMPRWKTIAGDVLRLPWDAGWLSRSS